MLSLKQKHKARSAARRFWVMSGGNIDVAKSMLEASPEVNGLDPATIALIVQLAMALWKFWKENHVSEPLSVAQSDEPLDFDLGEPEVLP